MIDIKKIIDEAVRDTDTMFGNFRISKYTPPTHRPGDSLYYTKDLAESNLTYSPSDGYSELIKEQPKKSSVPTSKKEVSEDIVEIDEGPKLTEKELDDWLLKTI